MYLSTGLFASLTSVWWHTNNVSAGASGAIFGLCGLFLATLLFANKNERKLNGGLIISILIFVGYNLLMGLAGNIDNAAHVGGLVSGFIIGAVLTLSGFIEEKRRQNLERNRPNSDDIESPKISITKGAEIMHNVEA